MYGATDVSPRGASITMRRARCEALVWSWPNAFAQGGAPPGRGTVARIGAAVGTCAAEKPSCGIPTVAGELLKTVGAAGCGAGARTTSALETSTRTGTRGIAGTAGRATSSATRVVLRSTKVDTVCTTWQRGHRIAQLRSRSEIASFCPQAGQNFFAVCNSSPITTRNDIVAHHWIPSVKSLRQQKHLANDNPLPITATVRFE